MALTRFNQSLLGPLERPALAWLAEHMPQWVVPDTLTFLGLFGALMSCTGFILSNLSLHWLWLTCVGVVLNWLGDSTDGTLARYRRIERPRYGFFVDCSSDLFSHPLTLLSIGLSPCAHFSIAALGAIAFLMSFAYTMIGAHARASFRVTYFGFGPTEIRASLLIGNLLTLALGIRTVSLGIPLPAGFGPLTTYDVVIASLALLGVVLLPILVIREGSALSIEDPRPQPRPPAT
jgi:phosphatidylglycerophosphate synthase